MSTGTLTSCIDQIGETAGDVWRCLDDHGRMSLAQLCKAVGAPRDVVMQGVGWLAREDKVEIEDTSRGRQVWLK